MGQNHGNISRKVILLQAQWKEGKKPSPNMQVKKSLPAKETSVDKT